MASIFNFFTINGNADSYIMSLKSDLLADGNVGFYTDNSRYNTLKI